MGKTKKTGKIRIHHRIKSFIKGFSLIELLFVVIIIGILAGITATISVKVIDKARAAKVASEYREIKKAFDVLKFDTGIKKLPRQTAYRRRGALPCQDEPALSATDLYLNVKNYPGWNGPYLKTIYKTPWNVEYTYDNDGDKWPRSASTGGVNLMIQWCKKADGRKAQRLAPILDKTFDKSDGRSRGQVRWTTSVSSGTLRILIDAEGE